jgi:hypothetical protein
VTSCTISANSARSGGGISNTDLTGTVTLGNTIVAGNTGGDISGSGILNQTYSLVGGQPRLGPLQDNGGPTKTMALSAGSPALNAGDPNQLGIADQRGVARSGGVNIGAYQASASALVVTGPATATAGTPFNVTVKAVDSFGQTAVGYTGTATFTSADPHGATLPADYHFTLADGGVHTFGAGATLYTAGNWDVTATDTVTGSITGSATVAVSQGLVLAPIPDQTIPSSQQTLNVPLSVSNPGGNPLTFTEAGQSLAYVLTQQTGALTYSSVWDNWGGRGEKWLLSASNQWYFILSTGQLYQWDGSSGATGTSLGNVGASYYADPTRLANPPANQPHATLNVSGNTLTITRDTAWVSGMVITVMVSDGTQSDSKTFDVFVTP